ncbi:hypothetical protein ABW20_dc0100575 [Dactylellina cionopaga]|nr:hypothetical protein ABW20_dc0100575 [Dactylellina cionopaga]
MADDYDEDLAEAIRRSLLDQGDSSSQANDEGKEAKSRTPTKTTRIKKEEIEVPIIILDDSDDDGGDDKELAIKTEQQPNKDMFIKKEEIKQEGVSNPTIMLNLNRRQMEEERLARLKRKTPDDSLNLPQAKHVKSLAQPSLKVKKEEPTDSSLPGPSVSQRNPFMTLRDLQQRVASYVPRATQYFDGVVKKTYIQGAERRPDDIKIEEVLQKVRL